MLSPNLTCFVRDSECLQETQHFEPRVEHSLVSVIVALVRAIVHPEVPVPLVILMTRPRFQLSHALVVFELQSHSHHAGMVQPWTARIIRAMWHTHPVHLVSLAQVALVLILSGSLKSCTRSCLIHRSSTIPTTGRTESNP